MNLDAYAGMPEFQVEGAARRGAKPARPPHTRDMKSNRMVEMDTQGLRRWVGAMARRGRTTGPGPELTDDATRTQQEFSVYHVIMGSTHSPGTQASS